MKRRSFGCVHQSKVFDGSRISGRFTSRGDKADRPLNRILTLIDHRFNG